MVVLLLTPPTLLGHWCSVSRHSLTLLRCCLIAPAVLLGNHKAVPGGPSRCSLCPLTGQLELLSDAPAKADKRRLPGGEPSCMKPMLSTLSAALHMLQVDLC